MIYEEYFDTRCIIEMTTTVINVACVLNKKYDGIANGY